MLRTTGILIATVALAGCQTAGESGSTEVAQAILVNAAGANVGTARLHQMGDQLTVNVALQGMPAGTRATHLHMVGDCSSEGFTSAGGHLNPEGHQHGSLNPQGQHLGDLPNATISADGTGTVSATLPGMSATLLTQMFDADGTAVVVHESPDDYRTDPTGAAGGRIACGAFRRS